MDHAYIELHVDNFSTALHFYQQLGFEKIWEEYNYIVVKQGDAVICFYGGTPEVTNHSYFGRFPSGTKRGYGVEVILHLANATELYQRLKDSSHIVAPLKKRPWGALDFRIEDPFGYYVRITEPYDICRLDKTAARDS